MKPFVATAVAVALLAFAAGAQAQQRYASPGGTGTSCAQGEPCLLDTAVRKAKNKDEVIIGSGSYTVEELVPDDYEVEDLFIHGDFSAPMPVITNSADEKTGLVIQGANSVLSWVDARASGQQGSAIFCGGGRVERVRAAASGPYGVGIVGGANCNIADSVAVATGAESAAMSLFAAAAGYVGSVTNSTALASGTGSHGISAVFAGLLETGKYTVDVTNTIAQGAAADLYTTGSSNEFSEIVASHSNFDKPVQNTAGAFVDAGGNQTAPPLFVDAAGGNYAEGAGSPTIDAGVVGPGIGALDLAGRPRTQGGTVDIGAFEIAPPPTQPSVDGQIQSLLLSPSTFVAANLGGAVISKKKPPVGTGVAYSLTAPATVTFRVERKASGRKVGKKCVKRTKANKGKPKCALLKPVKGSFTQQGSSGANIFKFSGRLGDKTLAPGSYRLTGSAGGANKQTGFKIVK
jgi:hypothetical protein